MTTPVDNPNSQEENQRPSKLRVWIMEMRIPFLTATLAPILLGTAIAFGVNSVFYWDLFLLTLIAGACLHLGANVSNDYFDHISKADDINIEFVRPFSGGSRMIQKGWLSPREVLVGAFVFFGIGISIGLYLSFIRGWPLLLIGAAGAFSAFFYSAPPFKLVTRGIGELFIGLNFGVLMTVGAFYVQMPSFVDDFLVTPYIEPVIASFPVALLITAVLYINEFPDFKADRDSGKRTLVVRLGRERAVKGYAVLMGLVYVWVSICVLMSWMAWESLIIFATLPVSYFGVRHAFRVFDSPFELVPANAATVTTHLLAGLILSFAYVLHWFMLDFIWIVIVGVIALIPNLLFYRKLSTPPSSPA